MTINRRKFIKNSRNLGLGLGMAGIPFLISACGNEKVKNKNENLESETSTSMPEQLFKISLAQWSLNKELNAGKLDHLDFAAVTKNRFGIHAVEYVNQFFADKAEDLIYLNEMNLKAEDLGVKQLLIMIDNEGNLGAPDEKERKTAVENHYKWVTAAKHLACHSIRVNAFGEGTAEEVKAAAIEGLGSLATFAQDYNINVIVENHGSYSSDGQWLSSVMKQINMPNCGTLPDFGNFCVERDSGKQWDGKCIKEYDRYKGVEEMLPYAKALSAKSHSFDDLGEETSTDFKRMIDLARAGGYKGYIGIEYEGSGLSADKGIMATKHLLEKYI